MNDVERLILEAWEKLGPKIMGDPQELARRLARRRMAILTRPVRAWCVAVRASDTRITPAHWIITPEHAMDLDHPEHPYEPIEHEVTIQPHALRKYCRPVRTDSMGELVADVCKQLGTTQANLRGARWAGLFTERIVRGLGGKRGKNVPLIHSWTTLDPSGRFFQRPDQLWGSLWEFLPDMIPDDFEQTIIRRPVFGFSGRGTPAIPRDQRYKDDQRFRGWRWLCPSCKKSVRIIYHPLPPRTLFDYLGYDPAVSRRCQRAPDRFLRHDVEKVEPPPPTFACGDCHQIQSFSRAKGHSAWNTLVSILTRGLLFGHEVPKPSWYRDQRKKARHRVLNSRPALKRQQILTRILNGWPEHEIAYRLLISLPSVRTATRKLCQQERVPNRHELAKKLGSKHPQPLNRHDIARQRRPRVQQLLLTGLSRPQIARQLRLKITTVHRDAKPRQHGLTPRQGLKALAAKMNIQLAGNYALNNTIRSLLLSGQSTKEIATATGLSIRATQKRCQRILRGEGVKDRKGLLEKYGTVQQSELAPPTWHDPPARDPHAVGEEFLRRVLSATHSRMTEVGR